MLTFLTFWSNWVCLVKQIDEFVTGLNENGSILIPQIEIEIEGNIRVYSLLSAQTHDEAFPT